MSGHVHTVSLSFDYATAEAATLVERAVRVEVGGLDDDRSTATVNRTGATVGIEITADDPVALRAGLNSWLRYVSVAETVADCGPARRA